MEKKLGKKSYLQFDVWAEKSFIRLGLDEQYVNMIGVSSSLMFGL